MWLSHQFRVAHGKEAPITHVSPFQNFPLRRHSAPVKKSQFAYRGASHRLWTSQFDPSGMRRWRTIEFSADDLRQGCRRTRGFTYNDLLATCALEVFSRWNRLHCDGRRQKLGLWLPVNIRQQSAVGFGNGTGRIRLYNSICRSTPTFRQVPRDSPANLLVQPAWRMGCSARTPFNLCHFGRLLASPQLSQAPWVDMATGVFSHADSWTGRKQ